jgi:hypothetical protein
MKKALVAESLRRRALGEELGTPDLHKWGLSVAKISIYAIHRD